MMIRTCFIILLLASYLHAFPLNNIRGCVTDASTGEPVYFAQVFLNSTTIGVTTNNAGYYLIENIPPGQYQLIVHHIGYERVALDVTVGAASKTRFDIALEPRILIGDTVQIEAASPAEWRKHLKFFTKAFLGETEYVRQCRFFNPEVLDFHMDAENNIMTASTDSVLILQNNASGYEINIILEDFTYNQQTKLMRFNTYPLFKEMPPENTVQKEEWMNTRKQMYQGSFRHFLSALARGSVEKEGFVMFSGLSDKTGRLIEKIVPIDTVTVIKTSERNIKLVYFKDWWIVVPNQESPDLARNAILLNNNFPNSMHPSYVKLLSINARIDTLGNIYDRNAFALDGPWQKERFANALPYDYRPLK